ncbi:hypothetical protein NDR87_02775 [Nocardia sp. CDC159]|uniref:UsfY protein n=1 Tax=Nocardia pulmonis TaxID=2951408 RepID=A0A9X2E5Q2_9NOCA|nr:MULTISPECIES: hypothetical protein [Nocardia]MCM6772063.1 hypothetical protein [Nocardia pulmonis]MCM6785279.1 hypothetical protein [Nocardia sp. CDC159]
MASADQARPGFPDTSRTTRSHAGEGIEDGYNIPGIVLCAIGLVALAGALTAAGYGFSGWAIVGGVVCAVSLVAGIGWLLIEHRRIKAKEGLDLHDQRGH